jgi:pilus assembly protein CpaB
MRKGRLVLTLFTSLGTGLAAAYLALSYVTASPTPAVASEPSSVSVVVAARDLSAGTIVTRSDVELADWPARRLPEGYSSEFGAVVGRGVMATVRRNEPLLDSRLADKEAGGGLPIVIPEGQRAVSVEVDEVISVAGFVLPGTRVDVLATVTPDANRRTTTTRTILQNILALAADQSYQQNPQGEPEVVTVVTLLVTPQQAEDLTLAATEGKIQLSLRNTLDPREETTTGRRLAELVGGSSGGRSGGRVSGGGSTTAPPADKVIEAYRGGSRTLIKFKRGGS